MRRMLLLVTAIAVAVIALFGLAEAAGVPVLTAPERYLAAGGAGASALAMGLLAADIVLPVPSSLVIAYLGAAHGAAIGAALATAAVLAGALVGFAIGRASRGAIGRWVGEAERARLDALLARWSMAGVAATRPVPVLAETVAVVAGTSPTLGWGRFAIAAGLGIVPFAALNAAAGAEARDGSFGLAVVAALVIGAALWLIGRRAGDAAEPAP
ncbi:MAG: VTT domain-containing protein [Kofleriaceae bacterium]|nr:VTT domain-containing protein [Kofleriaceae bacterium]MCB9573942.1 VTT domain-containing protein [Kofleriaceae bacterium]